MLLSRLGSLGTGLINIPVSTPVVITEYYIDLFGASSPSGSNVDYTGGTFPNGANVYMRGRTSYTGSGFTTNTGLIININANGNVVSSIGLRNNAITSSNSSGTNNVNGMVTIDTSNNLYIPMNSGIRYTQPVSPYNSNPTSNRLVKTYANANVQWAKYYNVGSNVSANFISFAGVGLHTTNLPSISGTARTLGNVGHPLVVDSSIFMKLDANGNITYSDQFYTSLTATISQTQVYSSKVSNNHAYLTGIFTNNVDSNTTSGQSSLSTFVTKYTNGNAFAWCNTLQYVTNGPQHLFTDTVEYNNEVYVVGTQNSDFYIGSSTSQLGLIIKYNSSGTIVWKYNLPFRSTIDSINLTSDNRLVCSAIKYLDSTSTSLRRKIVFEINSSGSIVWMNELKMSSSTGVESSSASYQVKTSLSGSYIYLSMIYTATGYPYLLKLPNNGNIPSPGAYQSYGTYFSYYSLGSISVNTSNVNSINGNTFLSHVTPSITSTVDTSNWVSSNNVTFTTLPTYI